MWAMLSSEWFDAPAAQTLGVVWDLVADDELIDRTSHVAATIAAHDPSAVTATKRLLTAGRADAARLATDRELHEMAELRRSPRSSEVDGTGTGGGPTAATTNGGERASSIPTDEPSGG